MCWLRDTRFGQLVMRLRVIAEEIKQLTENTVLQFSRGEELYQFNTRSLCPWSH